MLSIVVNYILVLVKLLLTWVYVMAIMFAEFDRKKWWCYLVMVASIILIWL